MQFATQSVTKAIDNPFSRVGDLWQAIVCMNLCKFLQYMTNFCCRHSPTFLNLIALMLAFPTSLTAACRRD